MNVIPYNSKNSGACELSGKQTKLGKMYYQRRYISYIKRTITTKVYKLITKEQHELQYNLFLLRAQNKGGGGGAGVFIQSDFISAKKMKATRNFQSLCKNNGGFCL